MSTTPSAQPQSPSSPPVSQRSPVERIIVWGVILILLVVVAVEYSARRSHASAFEKLNAKLEAGDKAGGKDVALTNFEVRRLLGNKKPEFEGHPGQISSNAKWYEAYVWKSLLRRQFTMPPKEPEEVDLFALYSGEVRPDLIKYRTPEPKPAEGFFAAPVLYVYYGPKDPRNEVREVVAVTVEREKYIDELTPLPDEKELERRHKHNLASMIANMEAMNRPKLTDEQKEKLDNWKYPLARSDENMRNVPGYIPGMKFVPKPRSTESEAAMEAYRKATTPPPQPEKKDGGDSTSKPGAGRPGSDAEDEEKKQLFKKSLEKKPAEPKAEDKKPAEAKAEDTKSPEPNTDEKKTDEPPKPVPDDKK